MWKVEKTETLKRNAGKAVERYLQRTGVMADTVYVHPLLLPDGDSRTVVPFRGELAMVTFRANASVEKGMIWVGKEEGCKRQAAGAEKGCDGATGVLVVPVQGSLWS